MPRPSTKGALIRQIQDAYAKLETLVSDLSVEEIEGQKLTTHWTTKDVLAT